MFSSFEKYMKELDSGIIKKALYILKNSGKKIIKNLN